MRRQFTGGQARGPTASPWSRKAWTDPNRATLDLDPLGLINLDLPLTEESCAFLRRYDRKYLELKVVAESVGGLSYHRCAVGLDQAKGTPLIGGYTMSLTASSVERTALARYAKLTSAA